MPLTETDIKTISQVGSGIHPINQVVKKAGILKRIGSNKGGHWQINRT